MSNPPPVAIAIAVVLHDKAVLIGPRPRGVPLAGFWEFPGGKVSPAETYEAAAARECLEETGLAVRIEGLVNETCWQYEQGAVQLRFFVAMPLEPAAAVREPFRWVPVAALSAYAFPPANAAVLQWLAKLWGRGEPQGGD